MHSVFLGFQSSQAPLSLPLVGLSLVIHLIELELVFLDLKVT